MSWYLGFCAAASLVAATLPLAGYTTRLRSYGGSHDPGRAEIATFTRLWAATAAP